MTRTEERILLGATIVALLIALAIPFAALAITTLTSGNGAVLAAAKAPAFEERFLD